MATLIRLVYTSHAKFEHTADSSAMAPEVIQILAQSRANNQKLNIGGVLYYADGFFFQCLEGHEKDVLDLVAKIEEDDRHENLKVSYCRKVKRRRFNQWSMKYVPVGERIQEFIRERGYKRFDPCHYDESDINALIDLLTRLEDTSVANEQLRECYKLRLHWWQRLRVPFLSPQ